MCWKVKLRVGRGTGIEQFPAVRAEEISLNIHLAHVAESLNDWVVGLLRRKSIRDNYRRMNFRHGWIFSWKTNGRSMFTQALALNSGEPKESAKHDDDDPYRTENSSVRIAQLLLMHRLLAHRSALSFSFSSFSSFKIQQTSRYLLLRILCFIYRD